MRAAVSPRNSQARFAAAYQLMASYLVWDFHDLLEQGQLSDPDAQDRLGQFIELLDHAMQALHPAYPAGRPEPAAQGAARAEQTRRLSSRNRDEELMNLIVAARGDKDRVGAGVWTENAYKVLTEVQEAGWQTPDKAHRDFIQEEVEPFLLQLQRIDEIDAYRPGKRPGLTRR
ncbi:MAG: hypothetical protein ACTHKT_12690 [Solirubrobacterales bacterium]